MRYTASTTSDPSISYPPKSTVAGMLRNGAGRLGASVSSGIGQWASQEPDETPSGPTAADASDPRAIHGSVVHGTNAAASDPDYDSAERSRIGAPASDARPSWMPGAPSAPVESSAPADPAAREKRLGALHQSVAASMGSAAPVDMREQFANLSAQRLNSGTQPLGAGSFSGAYSVAAAHASSAAPRGFGSVAGAARAGQTAPGPTGGLSGTSASTRAGVWGTGKGSGSQNGISSGTAEQFAQMPQSNGSV